MPGPGDDAYTWGNSRFRSWFILLWLPQLKSEDHTKHSNSLHYKAALHQLNWRFWDDSFMGMLWCYVMRLDLYQFSSSVVYKHRLTRIFYKIYFFLSPRPFTAAMGKGLASLPVCRPVCMPALIMIVMQTVTLLLFQRQLTFLQPDTRFAA